MDLHTTALQGSLDVHVNSRSTWRKACSSPSQSVPFSFLNNSFFPRTLLSVLMKSIDGLSWNIPVRSCLTTASTVGAVVLLFLWPPTSYLLNTPQGSEAAGLSAGANGPIPQSKRYSGWWWQNCVGLLLLSTPGRTIVSWWDLSVQTKRSLMNCMQTWMQ